MSMRFPLEAPSDQLLRTLASVPVSSSVLDLGCGAGEHTEALLRLGFPVHACDPRPDAIEETRTRVRDLVDEETAKSCVQERTLDALDELDTTFDWVIAFQTAPFVDSKGDLRTLLETGHSLLEPGGWLYLAVPALPDVEEEKTPEETRPAFDDVGIRLPASDLEASRLDTPLVESRSPSRVEENGETRVHAIYRRVRGQTPA